MTTWVFVGPTLPRAEVAALLPAALVRPPVRHGDLLRLDPRADDTVLIIDGFFLQTASVRHREIMALLQRGVTVAGSSSMGALRAAELWRYGMRGYGEVFRLYRDGVIDGDDEVAIVHGTGEDGHRPYSDPAVAIRVALRDAAAAGAIGAEEAARALAEVVATPFRARSFRATERGMPAAAAQRFRAWRAGHECDVKADDARLLLTAAAAADAGLRPAGPGDEPVRNVHTWIFDMWEHRHHGGTTGGEWVADGDASVAIRLFHPRFRELHRLHVLAQVAGVDPEDPDVVERAVAVARARGLAPTGTGGWITPAELAGPADELLATLLVRAFGCARRWSPTRGDLPPALRGEQALGAGRAVVLAARRRAAPAAPPAPGDVDRAMSAAWGCPPESLEQQAWDRGIPDTATLRAVAAPFATYVGAAEETITAARAVMTVV